MSVSKEQPMVLYQQVASTLKEEILNGTLAQGKRIGSQKELEDRFNVSKITIRKAISLLEEDDLVVTIHGKGTYVTKDKVKQNLDHLQSLTDIIKMSGFEPKIAVIKKEHVKLEDTFIDETGIECLYVERLHSIKENPVAIAKIYIPAEYGETINETELEANTIYELLEKQGIAVKHATQSIEACPATEALGKILNVDVGTPLLKAKRYTYNTEGKLVEKIVFYYRYDAFAFKVDLNSISITPMWPSEQVKQPDT